MSPSSRAAWFRGARRPAAPGVAGAHRPSPGTRSGHGAGTTPWYRRIYWMGAIWVLFLIVPLIFTLTSSVAWPYKMLTSAGIIGFIAAYVVVVSTMEGWEEFPQSTPAVQHLRRIWPSLAILLGLAAVTLPVLGWWACYFTLYLNAIILFSLPLRRALSIVLPITCLVAVAAIVLAPAPELRWSGVGAALSTLGIVCGRVGEELSHRHYEAERRLAAVREREEISRDVHDILGHSLTVLTLKAEVAQRLLDRDPEAARRELDEVIGLSRSALGEVRATVTRLRTPDLASQLEASRTALRANDVELSIRGGALEVPEGQRSLLAWALREATTNVVRHAGAGMVRVELGPGLLRVADDGAGLGASVPGNGLRGLRSRVEAAGGRLEVSSPAWPEETPPLRGTLVEVRLP